jgi:hypothetical protein
LLWIDNVGVSKRGVSPSSVINPPLLIRIEIQKESLREAKPRLYIHSSFLLARGRGIKGDRVPK